MKTIKQILPLIFASIIGGIIAISASTLLTNNKDINALNRSSAHQVNYRNLVLPSAFDFREAALKAQKSVVRISAAESEEVARQRLQNRMNNGSLFEYFFGFGGQSIQPQKGSGSGVILSEDGYIVTNNHVIDFADEIEVILTDDRSFRARIIGTDPATDLAVLKIEASNLPAIEFGDSDKAAVGEWVMAVGNPYDYLTSTVTAGIISAKGRELNQNRNKKTIEDFIQTDAVVNPGNSGGALVDVNGRLIGINTMIYTRTGSYIGYSFAIPVNMMQEVTKDIIENGKGRQPKPQVYQNNNQPNYRTLPGLQPRQPRGPRLGITIAELDDNYAQKEGLSFNEGLVVEQLVNGGNAQYAGLLPNDIIVKVNDTRVRNGEDIIDLLDRSEIGDILQVKVFRQGRFKTIPLKLRS
ncbi:MAG: trypsin-like peptidase domain-containing protein [Bacteroidia bacterium]|nr:trypsin-like peptidase domain-containing protein [Bacteroidia bacterium]